MNLLLAYPEEYRCGENYSATHILFPVEFNGQKYIAKKPRFFHPLIEGYYVFQDAFFYGSRKYAPLRSLWKEAEKLRQLNGCSAPHLVGYKNGTLIREYLEGTAFPQLLPEQQPSALEKGLEALIAIHENNVALGDAHVKNIFSGQRVCWIDLDGVFEEDPPFLLRAKALDLLKFVYSTYTVTKDKELTIKAAELVSHYPQQEVRICLNKLVTPGLGARRLWFPTRLSDEELNSEIKTKLRTQLSKYLAYSSLNPPNR